MTRRRLSWTSREEIERLVSRLSAPIATEEVPRERSAAPATAAPAPAIAPALPTPAAAIAVPLPATASSPGTGIAELAIPELVLSSTSLVDRVRAYCEWALETFDASSAFLSDEHGLMVHGVTADPSYVAALAPLLIALDQVRAMLHADASRGGITVRPAEVLIFAECVTRTGRYCIGLVRSDFLDDSHLALLQGELNRTFEEPHA